VQITPKERRIIFFEIHRVLLTLSKIFPKIFISLTIFLNILAITYYLNLTFLLMKHYHPCFDELIAHLLTFLPDIDPRFPDLLRPLLSYPFTVKNDLQIFKPGDIADYAFWPVEGFIRFYERYKPHEDDSEEEFQKTISTSFPGKIALCADSFMNQNPVNICVEILKGSTMVAFSHSAFQTIGAQIPQVATLALNILSDAEEDWKRRVQICRVKGLAGYQLFWTPLPMWRLLSFKRTSPVVSA
jgi:hypothetical protein